MNISRIEVRGLHGFLSAKISLKESLAILVGVNGSGKTSILNLTAHVLKLNIPELSAVQFSTFKLTGRVGSKSFEIRVARGDCDLDIALKLSGRVVERLVVRVPTKEELDIDGRSSRFAYDRAMRRVYEQIAPSKTAAFLKKNVRLTLVRLDRSLFAEDSAGGVAVDAPLGSRKGVANEAMDPIDRVRDVTSDRYNKYRIAFRKHNEELTRQIVLQLFKAPKNLFSSNQARARLSSSQIEALKRKVSKMPYFGESDEVMSQVREYFELAIAAIDPQAGDSPSAEHRATRFLFRDFEFPRINGLVKAFDQFEASDNKSRAELDRLEMLINSFLDESGKEVFFSEKEASLRFRLKRTSDPSGRAISELSSGEKQIVIVLTYLGFLAGENSIFVVDEPELSLHLSWQMKLVEALQSLRPQGSQLVLATHSPEIVGSHRSAVVRVSPDFSAG